MGLRNQTHYISNSNRSLYKSPMGSRQICLELILIWGRQESTGRCYS
jgi:hypothetical protein